MERMGKVSIIESIFKSCEAKAQDDYGGGGIEILSVNAPPQISGCSFASCSTLWDAGGVGVWYSYSPETNSKVICNCHIISCKGDSSNPYSECGGSRVFCNHYNVGLSNTLFSHCSNYRGGALEIQLPLTVSTPAITFCLFHANDATGSGKDIWCSSNSNPISHTFTTSTGNNRIYPEHWDNMTQQDNWLPQGSIYFADSNSDGRSDDLGQTKHTWLDVNIHTSYLFY